MVFVQERKSKGIVYLYLDKSIRIGTKIHKLSKFLGKKSDLSKKQIEKEVKKFVLDVDQRTVDLLIFQAKKRFKFNYPLTIDEVKKIEEMNLKYKEIKRSLNKKDWEDIKKRFIANFVFESNALEGNSLTLKNFTDVVFENKVANSTDLREVYDAKNSYGVFSRLFVSRKEITEKFMLDLHQKIMKNIDDRVGYKTIPNVILGRNIKLTKPENVALEIKNLIKWYDENKNKVYPLELAFRFHHKFELIHPFADGNGRVGRMLLNYILIKQGYYPLIIRKNQRTKYLKALQVADSGKWLPLMRFSIEKMKETYRKFFETYYQYI